MIRQIHYGVVTDNADPERRGCVKVRCDTIVKDSELPFWIPPVFQWLGSSDDNKVDSASLWIPDIGVTVELELEVDNLSMQGKSGVSAYASDMKYRGHALPNKDADLPDELKESYPYRRGWVTRARHMFIFDDSQTGSVILAHGAGTRLEMNANGEVIIQTPQGAIKVELLKTGEAKVTASSKVVLEAPTIELTEGAVSDIIKGTEFQTFFDTHTHPTPAGASSPPTVLMSVTSGLLSTRVKTG